MGSWNAKLSCGPWQLRWHSQNGSSPFELTARVLGVLDSRPDPAFQKAHPDIERPRPDLLQAAWAEFLTLRKSIAQQVNSVAHGDATRKYGKDPFLNLKCQEVSLGEAAADYLRYLPPVLVPSDASRYLPQREVDACQKAFEDLSRRVETYLATHAPLGAEAATSTG